MKANELRIGNLVWDNYSGEMIVSGISKPNGLKETLTLKKQDGLPEGSYLCESIEPIPLTEEWLLKFGFHKRKACGNYWFEKSINKLLFLTNDINPVKGNAFSTKVDHVFVHDFNWQTKIKYVHQLQNLYFALAGEELILK
jgi:hypothetical protein